VSTEVRLGPVSYLVLGIIAMRGPSTPYRDLGLLKLFFAELAEPDVALAPAQEQAAAQRAQLAGYEALIARFAGRPELAKRVRSAELGVRLARAAAEFWEDVVERESGADAAYGRVDQAL
jgi:hypothetical protein